MELPQGGRAIHNLALREGWGAEIVPGEGAAMLRLHRPGVLIAGIWTKTGGFQGAWARPWGPGGLPAKYNVNQLREILAIPADEFQWPPDPLLDQEPDDVRENMALEREYLGAYLTRHPLEFVSMRRYPDVISTFDLLEQEDDLIGERLQLLGLIENATVARAKRSGNWWAGFSLTDLTPGVVRCLAFGQVAQRIDEGALMHLRGKLERRDESPVFIAYQADEVTW